MRELEILADEIRERLVQTVSVTGGHLASNLGVVELTLALHLVLDTPRDKLVWDVSHQTYVHKLLTGRRESFGTLRQQGGLSGFASRAESEYDPYGAGHGSTAISAAVGMAIARDHLGQDHQVVAVIGDGALTGGLAYEGLNQAGQLKPRLVVILNDNEMSISPNVGAIAAYLSRVRMDPHYQRAKEQLEMLARQLPLGDTMVEAVEWFKAGIKRAFEPGRLFVDLGWRYYGPIDGHNLPVLCDAIDHALKIDGPVLLHVMTCKGKGYGPSEKHPTRFHGVSAFDVASGRLASEHATPTYGDVFVSALIEEAKRDSRVVAISAAMLSGTRLERFAKKFPKRCFDVGMAEEHAITLASGMAAAGLRPFVVIYSTFLQRAYDQLIHDVCLQNLPVKIGVDRAGLVGDDGPTHHGVFDLSYLRSMPNMVIMAPKDESELARMFRTMAEAEGPVAMRYPRGRGRGLQWDTDAEPIEVGKAETVRDGDDVTIVAVGPSVYDALEVADTAEKNGLSLGVINARFVKPLDEELIIESARRTGALVTVEENVAAGGFGSAVVELLQTRGLTGVRVQRLALPDQYVEHGNVANLRDKYGIGMDAIREAVVRLAGHGVRGAQGRQYASCDQWLDT